MPCDVCGLPRLNSYRARGDGIGSCDCPRCKCGEALDSQFCICADYEDDYDYDDDDGDY